MFRFGFCNDSEDTENEPSEDKETLHGIKCEEVKPDSIVDIECLKVNSIKCGDHILKHICSDEVLDILKSKENVNDLLINADRSHSDLIAGVYEGGLKIWECTYDLLNFINDNCLDLSNKSILDLGCGAGIIGIKSCLKGASLTCFQDYNTEVIKWITGINVKLNNIPFDQCKFYGGDWGSFLNLLKSTLTEDKKFDYIFTSETIYNVANYSKLLDIFKQLLKKNGTIYLAAKYYYFGVGGGIGQFEETLQKYNAFNYSTAWLCSEGVKRAIIKISLK